MMDAPALIEVVILLAGMVGAGIGGAKFRSRKNGKAANRPQMMSVETKRTTKDMWDKMQLQKTCEAIHKGSDQRLAGIDENIKTVRQDIKEVLRLMR